MSTTLTNGLKLPDKGSVDWYADMQSNYAILDGAVGTVADHTTALSGKAPLVHTHTKSDITDFPAYGTTAGTICEGNDSRLSDARTPVAHTHTKSDVTDLLNSDFIPLANNSYDLGSSSYQWNKVYSKEYYYNGTAWGLDKANTWTNAQTYSTGFYGEMVWLKNTDLDLSVNGNTGLSSTCQHIINWCDKNNTAYSVIQSWTNSSENTLVLRSKYRTDANTVRDLSVRFTSTATNKVIHPETNADIDLGTTDRKWKTINGINPGALSFPKVDGWASGTEINAVVGIDTTNWDMTGGTWNQMTNNVQDGWVYFAFQNCGASDRSLVRYYGTDARFLSMSFNTCGSVGGGYYLYIAFPMAKGSTVNIAFTTTGTVMSKFIYPCLGNV